MSVLITFIGGACVLAGVSISSHALAIIGGVMMYFSGHWNGCEYERLSRLNTWEPEEFEEMEP